MIIFKNIDDVYLFAASRPVNIINYNETLQPAYTRIIVDNSFKQQFVTYTFDDVSSPY